MKKTFIAGALALSLTLGIAQDGVKTLGVDTPSNVIKLDLTQDLQAKKKRYWYKTLKNSKKQVTYKFRKWYDSKGRITKSIKQTQYKTIKKNRVARKTETRWYKKGKISKKQIIYKNTKGKYTKKAITYYSKGKKTKTDYRYYSNGKSTKRYITWYYSNGRTKQRDSYYYKKYKLRTGASFTRKQYYSNKKMKYYYKGLYNSKGKRINSYRAYYNSKGKVTKKQDWKSNKWVTRKTSTPSKPNTPSTSKYDNYRIILGQQKLKPTKVVKKNGKDVLEFVYEKGDAEYGIPDEKISVNADQFKSSVYDYDAVFRSQMLNLINVERQKRGLHKLVLSSDLNKAANIRAKELHVFYSSAHLRPDGSPSYTVFDDVKTSISAVAENISPDDEPIAKVLYQGWYESIGHRNNMMNETATYIGVGMHFDVSEKSFTFVQEFGF